MPVLHCRNFGSGRSSTLNVPNAERVWNSDLFKRGVKVGHEGVGRSALALIKTDEGNEYRYLVVYDKYELHGDVGTRLDW